MSYLILRIERDDTCLVRTNDRLASFDDSRAGFVLEFIGNEEQQETALQQVDPEEERHEAEVGIILQDVINGQGGRYSVRGGGDKALRGYPEVVVVE